MNAFVFTSPSLVGYLRGCLPRAHKKFIFEKKCHFATCPVFIGVCAVALGWH